jgi:hypothetical protein
VETFPVQQIKRVRIVRRADDYYCFSRFFWYRLADGNLRKRFWTARRYSSFSQEDGGQAGWLKKEANRSLSGENVRASPV